MPTIADRVFREFNRYTGDGLPGEPVAAPLPIGDPSSGVKTLRKAEIRDWANEFAGAVDSVIGAFNVHPLAGSLVMSYDPQTLVAHPGGLMYDPTESRVWRVYSEAMSHAPEFGMPVYADYSDDGGAAWKGRRTICRGNRRAWFWPRPAVLLARV